MFGTSKGRVYLAVVAYVGYVVVSGQTLERVQSRVLVQAGVLQGNSGQTYPPQKPFYKAERAI